MRYLAATTSLALLLCGCAAHNTPEAVRAVPTTGPQSAQAAGVAPGSGPVDPSQRVLKRKVAIGRFSNETAYGGGLLTDRRTDRLGKQASDLLASDLTKSGKFVVLERMDLDALQAENALLGMTPEEFKQNLVGVDALILGSVVEFGRKDAGEVTLFSRTRKQVAQAKVAIRLVDPRTGHVFFSETGSGEAAIETQTILGLGDRAVFDSTLNDKALSAAIASLMDKLMRSLADKPWTSGILSVRGTEVAIAGGPRQGLRAGDRLKVVSPGKMVRSPQTGFPVPTPPQPVGELEVTSFFGDSELTEGAICRIVLGEMPTPDHTVLY